MPTEPDSETRPLFVRLPRAKAEKLDRAAETLGVPKRHLVSTLVGRFLDPDSPEVVPGLREAERPEWTLGRHSFEPSAAPDVLTLAQAAELLQADEEVVEELAEAGDLPGRKIGGTWRFARRAVLAWLSAGETGE